MTRQSLGTWRQDHLCHYSQGRADAHLTGEACYHPLQAKASQTLKMKAVPSSALSVGLFSTSSLAPLAIPEQDMDPSMSSAGGGETEFANKQTGAGLTPYLPHSNDQDVGSTTSILCFFEASSRECSSTVNCHLPCHLSAPPPFL